MINFPFQKQVKFAPVSNDEDELIQAIANDPQRQDDRWQLRDDVDPDRIDSFWDEALRDLGDQDDFSD